MRKIPAQLKLFRFIQKPGPGAVLRVDEPVAAWAGSRLADRFTQDKAGLLKGNALSAEEDSDTALKKCASLTPREKEVLRAMGMRRRAKEIARELNISEHTVRGYANDAKQKLGLTSIRDAAVLFLQFERLQQTPQNRGGRFQRVSEHHSDAAVSSRGLSDLRHGAHDRVDDAGAGTNGASGLTARATSPSNRLLGLYGWMARLSVARWFGMTVLLTVGVIMAFGLAAMTVLGVFEVLHLIGGQHR